MARVKKTTTTVTDEEAIRQAFLKDIIARPEDDAPRAAYADWLKEQPGEDDQAQGEFIRLQLECARLHREQDDDTPWDAEADKLEAQADKILSRYQKLWVKPLGTRVRDARFDRGFVACVEMTWALFLAHGAEVFSLTPATRLKLVEVPGDDQIEWLRELDASPILRRLDWLKITLSGLGDAQATLLIDLDNICYRVPSVWLSCCLPGNHEAVRKLREHFYRPLYEHKMTVEALPN
jgi:uncharacterized protein (TIGR02996 family)